MKIVQLIHALDFGGAEKFCLSLSNALSKENNVTLLSLRDHTTEMIPLSLLAKSVKFTSLGAPKQFSPSIFLRTYRALKKANPDIIHSHLSGSLYAIPYALIHRKKVVHTIHNLAHKDSSKMVRCVLRLAFAAKIFHPIAISNEVLISMQQLFSPKYKHLVVNGVTPAIPSPDIENVKREIESYKKTSQTRVIINIASVKPVKNQLFLVKSIKSLIEEGQDIVFINLGEVTPENRSYFESFSHLLNDRMYFLGLKNNVQDYLSCSDIFCLSSVYEGLPLTLLEAMNVGTIPLCTPAGGIKDVLNEVKGIGHLYDHDNFDDFRKKVLRILDKDEQILQKEQQHLKNIFQREYDISICAGRYLEIYKSLQHD